MLCQRHSSRTYTEIQLALPRELGKTEREELAQKATRELRGDRFAYTMAIHSPLAKDNIDQPHMRLIFSECVVDATTHGLNSCVPPGRRTYLLLSPTPHR
ncbi:MAG: MobA/MobL family protein [Acidobacteriota bacterium]|nr:MobA/MobL family protein [Acidobacteriota bacterium]